jgi:hypothetical protein
VSPLIIFPLIIISPPQSMDLPPANSIGRKSYMQIDKNSSIRAASGLKAKKL